MPTEFQNIEFKESWRDEYQKWICGFANAQGGVLYVGIKDNGEVCGVQDAKKLMEDIPNKVRDMMGILVDVNLKEKDGKSYLEIVTEAYPYPVSFRGKYYQRSGATNQELKGAALDRFMLRKQGKTWDGVPVPYLKAEDLDNATFDLFRKYAKRSGRMEEADLMDDNHGLLEKLRLYEGSYLKRAAALLFHTDPEKYITGAFVKVGFFREGMDLVYQDEVHGNLFQQIVKLMDLLCTKYMKAIISYEGIQRIERYFVPDDALREALLNALCHKQYESGIPIQISVYEDKLYIANCGKLPENWTVENLMSKHASKPYNPAIANVFYLAGLIESWGRGIEKICQACEEDGSPAPVYTAHPGDIMIQFTASENRVLRTFVEKVTDRVTDRVTDKVTDKVTDGEREILSLLAEDPAYTYTLLAQKLDVSRKTVSQRIKSLKEKGVIQRMGSEKKGYWKIHSE